MLPPSVKELKRESSQWAKTKGPALADFFWQSGYAAFSISPGHVEALRSILQTKKNTTVRNRSKTNCDAC